MHSSLCLAVAGLAGAVLLDAFPLAAQDKPPGYLQIFREEVKVGRTGPHEATEAGWPRAFAKSKIQNHYIGMVTVFGPNEAWFMEGHESVAEIEDVNTAIFAASGLNDELDRLSAADAANVSSARAILSRYRPELSNGVPVNLAEMRIWEVVIFQVRPGHEVNFVDAAKLYKTTVETAKVDYSWATYEVLAGMPAPTYLVLIPHRTLSEIDPATGAMADLEKSFTPESMQKLSSLAEGYASTEDMVFAVRPRMSYLSAEFVARDADFWSPKPEPKSKRAAAAQ